MLRPLRCEGRDEDAEGSLADMLTLLSPALFVFVLIAFSSSPLTISPSERGEADILPALTVVNREVTMDNPAQVLF